MASRTGGLSANFFSIQSIDGSVGRPYIQDTRPSANRFLQRAASRGVMPVDPLGGAHRHRGHRHAEDLVVVERVVLERVRLVAGLAQVVVGEAVLVDDHRAALLERGRGCVISAAGFIATSTFGWSPGVRMSREAKWIWKAETPCGVPAGARISAGKSGSVARSLPDHRGGVGEAAARELHPIAGVAGEPDDDAVLLLDRLVFHYGAAEPTSLAPASGSGAGRRSTRRRPPAPVSTQRRGS